MSFFVIEGILIVVSIILANKMVANRKGFAKRFIIGKDSETNIEKMKQFAEGLLVKEVTDPELEDLTINVEIRNGKIVKTIIESDKTKIISSKENGTNYFNQAWSKRGAVALTAFTLWGIALWFHIIIALWVEVYTFSQSLPH